MEIKENYPLKELNTFGLDVKARFFTEIRSTDELIKLTDSDEFKNYPHFVLGGGSNILFTGDFNGLVIKMLIKGIEEISKDESHVVLKIGAGEVWDEVVTYCVDRNYGGIENLSLIPGTAGASPIQNIGAYGTELKDIFVKLEGLNLISGEVEIYSKAECGFGYRDSIFKRELKNKFIITSIYLELDKNPVINIEYDALKKELCNYDSSQLNIKIISETVKRIRQSKLPDTAVLGNAGSFFKNPEITEQFYNSLKELYTDIPGYPAKENYIKVPAGWLIQKSGWRGKRIGNTGSYEKQALVLVNYGGASGKEVLDVSQMIINDVDNKFGITLEREVNIL